MIHVLQRPVLCPKQAFEFHVRTRPFLMICHASGNKIAGMGGVGLDLLAVVSSYPKPDQKIRSEAFDVFPSVYHKFSFLTRFKEEATAEML